MSSGKRIDLSKAISIESQLRPYIEPFCTRYNIAGSIRRKRETVGDIELVIIPSNAPALFAKLDGMVEQGIITKALYNTAHGLRPRWGEKLRCFRYQGATVELSISNEHKYGYRYWLCTGPSQANHYVMSQMDTQKSAIRFKDGYGWLTEYIGGTPVYKDKLHIPTEETLFNMLNLPFTFPEWRTESFYRSNWRKTMSANQLAHYLVPKQRTLL